MGLETATVLAISTLVMSAAGAGASLYSQGQQAAAQARYQEKVAQQYNDAAVQNAKNANEEIRQTMEAESARMAQETENAATKSQDIQKEALQKAGTAAASSEAAGVNFNMLMDDFKRQEANYRGLVETQLSRENVQSRLTIDAATAKTEARKSASQSYIQSPVSQPDYLGAVFNIGKGALNSYSIATNGGKTNLFGEDADPNYETPLMKYLKE